MDRPTIIGKDGIKKIWVTNADPSNLTKTDCGLENKGVMGSTKFKDGEIGRPVGREDHTEEEIAECRAHDPFKQGYTTIKQNEEMSNVGVYVPVDSVHHDDGDCCAHWSCDDAQPG